VALSEGQTERLVRVFCSMINTRDYPWEFAAYLKLWRRLAARAPASLAGLGQ
jgi:hypothetical protein